VAPDREGLARDRRAFAEGRGVIVGTCDLIWVEGPDAERFLQGLLSNDVAALAAGESCPALLLDDKGRIRAGMTVHRDGPAGFTLVLDGSAGASVAATLADYHFSEDLEVLGPEPADRICCFEGISHPQVDVDIRGRLPGTRELIIDDLQEFLDGADLVPVAPDLFHLLRIEMGVPRIGVDTGQRTLVQEAGLEDLTVSFSKGCYLGQETVSRAQHRGGVRRRLRGLSADGPLPVGATVSADGTELGTLTSAAESPEHGHIGLAILRTQVAPGDRVQVDGRTARVSELPFAE
jgi:folate-binding protein YgfZ